MELDEARTILGVAASATPAEIRAAYRRLVRVHHPDVTPGQAATAHTVRLNEAYALLRRPPSADAPDGRSARASAPSRTGSARPQPRRAYEVRPVDGDTLAVAAPAEEAFFVLLEAAHRIGDVTHIDVDGGLLETLVTGDDGRIFSLVMSFQGRGNGTTEAFLTLEALDSGPCPPVSALTDYLAATISLA